MNYRQEFSRLTRPIGVLVNPDFTEDEFRGLVERQIDHHPDLSSEVIRSFEDANFS